ncbi:hypothetical protein CWI84_10390 [Idiomarina tyrosinivorans]|uniref:YcgL domain-containing protein CWI84_10390 n=1 Tax=Idiomarina tyrosinivorans TaxID=1445662 RepID=A0A432ZM04_9GAMM|nr:YcgL domain-containing protein [Idiomarina tyrosinivorans]RUO78742.1 hypothetical protein CWI84_10390 [Idiomarina tyrosinivorans]
MLCVVYRSRRKADTFVYLPQGKDFSELPETLTQAFGQPEQVMTINLAKRKQLARLSVDELQQHLADPGYYLQMPESVENLLNTLPKTAANKESK